MFSRKQDGKFFLNTAVEGKNMPGERDIRLIGLLRATLGFVDGLRDIGVEVTGADFRAFAGCR